MTQDIKDYISTCSICKQYKYTNQKEPLMSHNIPDRPWSKIGTDLFSLNNQDYLITVDYFSNFWEIDKLMSTDSKAVIGMVISMVF